MLTTINRCQFERDSDFAVEFIPGVKKLLQCLELSKSFTFCFAQVILYEFSCIVLYVMGQFPLKNCFKLRNIYFPYW